MELVELGPFDDDYRGQAVYRVEHEDKLIGFISASACCCVDAHTLSEADAIEFLKENK